MSKQRTGKLITWVFVGIALLLAAIPAMFLYMNATATVHPNPEAVPSVAQSAPSAEWAATVEKARALVRARLLERNLPGLSVAVGVAGKIVWAEGFGLADLESGAAVTPDHRFRIGTASIALTSAGVGLLLEKGKLKLEDPIQSLASTFPKKEWPVTLRQVMASTAGIPTDGGDEGPLFGEQCEKPVEAFPHFAERSLRFEPGTAFRLSSFGWILVSAAVEAAAAEPFLAFMSNSVFGPLQMKDTVPDDLAEPTSPRATAYFPRFAADTIHGLHPMREVNLSCYAGASVFVSTPSDLVRFGMAVQDGKLLQRSTVERLQRSERLASGEETGYGLGWDLETVALAGKQTRVAGHDGDVLGGQVSSLLTFPEQGITVAVISNISYADTFSLGVEIAEVFTDAK